MPFSKVLSLLYSPNFLTFLSSQKVLVVGAGGIGCELLKVLSKFPFSHICIIDLDTIEVSNLNRQFLFRKEHKGMSKAEVAKATLESMNPSLRITAYQANIKEFGIQFFRTFDIFFSALDNAEARSFLNSICVMLNKPLLEAGTTGFKGQAMLLKRGISQCYDCEPKSQAKTYQVCTIRTLPEKPLHCVIWAKYLFGVLFGPMDEGNLLEDLREKLLGSNENLAEAVFAELFEIQIKKQKDSDPEKFKKLEPLILNESEENLQVNEEIIKENESAKQKIYSIQNYCHLFLWSFRKLIELKKNLGSVAFEKDDELCIKFITAASNLRSFIFSIDRLNEFQTKEIAGNIIPAICSTNAIVAAIEVSETLKYLNYIFKDAPKNNNKECYVQNDKEKKINAAYPGKPNPKCLICHESLVPCLIFLNMESFTLKDFFEKIISRISPKKKEIPDCTLMQQNLILYEQGDYLEEDEIETYQKKLSLKLCNLFKGLNDIQLTLTFQDNLYIKFLLIHDSIISESNFTLENDFLNHSKLGNLKEMMINNKMDYEEQVEREENDKKPIKGVKNLDGIFEIEDSEKELVIEDSDKDDIIIEENLNQKNSLKRKRQKETNNEGLYEKPIKQIKID